jgi:hypothetical protein
MEVAVDRVRLKGGLTRRGEYIDAKLYQELAERIAESISASPLKILTIDELIQNVTADPLAHLDDGELSWLTIQVKNDLIYKKLLINSFEDITQRIRLSLEGEKYFAQS